MPPEMIHGNKATVAKSPCNNCHTNINIIHNKSI